MSVDSKMTAIADAIREKTGKTEKLNLDDMATGVGEVYNAGFEAGQNSGGGGGDTEAAYNEGFEAGKQAEYDAFWDTFQLDRNTPTGRRLHYAYAFAYGGWTDVNYNPKYPITPCNTSGIGSMFTWNVKVSDTKVPITAYGSCSNAFANSGIVRIPKLIFNGATNVSNMFLNCAKLEELYCEGEFAINGLDLSACTKLNRESIESVIDVLSDTTSGLSVTLSKTAVENVFPPYIDGEEIYDNLDWISLTNTKQNWTINLV
jgi:hypothetical protein